jgi:hypothetical protein
VSGPGTGGAAPPVNAPAGGQVVPLFPRGGGSTGGPSALRGSSAALRIAPVEPASLPAPVTAPARPAPLALAPPAVGPGPAPTASVGPTAVAIAATVTEPKQDEQPQCPYPTGRTRQDPIPIQWFKPPVDRFYPASVEITRPHPQVYERTAAPSRLPHGEPFGVFERRWPSVGKILQYKFWDRRGAPAQSDFYRELLANDYGWRPSRAGLDVDHVQDPQWGEPDGDLNGASLDVWSNLWPVSRDLNRSAGALQNIWQRVSYCVGPNSTPRVNVPVARLRDDQMWGRYFVIRRIDFTREQE